MHNDSKILESRSVEFSSDEGALERRQSVVNWLTRVGVTVAVVFGVVFLWRGLLIFAAAIALIVVGAYVGDRWRKWRALNLFRAVWGTRGRDLLLVYSNSPHWQRYIEETWLPKWGHRAVVLNWSERSRWGRPVRPEVALFRAFGGATEFNPLAIVIPAGGRHVHVVRFWRAFRDFKHGRNRLLQTAEEDLARLLAPAMTPVVPMERPSDADSKR